MTSVARASDIALCRREFLVFEANVVTKVGSLPIDGRR